MAINVTRFNVIVENDTDDFKTRSIKTIIPSPTENDYKVGYIQRYFIQKRSDTSAYIYEVSKSYYMNVLNNPFFKGVMVQWKISGNREEVKEMNRKSISYSSKDMKTLPLYLPNRLQFHKERV
jgi:hypothetical protein